MQASPERTSSVVPATPSFAIHSLDHLNPQLIPESERATGQPAELVGVIGEHRMREWSMITGLAFDSTSRYVLAKQDVILGPHAWSAETFDAAPFFAIEDSPQGIPRFSRDGSYAFTQGRISRVQGGADGSPRSTVNR